MKRWRWRKPIGTEASSLELASRALADTSRRLEDVELALEAANRRIATLELELGASVRRCNALVDLTEQRFDLIYRRVTSSLSQFLSLGGIEAESDASIDNRLAELLSAGLRAEFTPADIDIGSIISEKLRPGSYRPPLSLYGFRLDRSRGREQGNGIAVFASPPEAYGVVLYGPYKRLAPGRYRAAVSVDRSQEPSGSSEKGELAFDVYSPGSKAVLADSVLKITDLRSSYAMSVDFDWSHQSSSDVVEFRLHQRSSVAVLITTVRLEALVAE